MSDQPSWRHTATLLRDGRVLFTGGTRVRGDVSTRLYDPHSNTWRETGSLHVRRLDATATLLDDGRVLLAGGWYFKEGRPAAYLSFAEVYDPAVGVWQPTGPMIMGRAHHTATLLADGTVLVVGGGAFTSYCPCGTSSYSELFDPATGGWNLSSPMTVPRVNHSATLLRTGAVLITGGSDAAGHPVEAAEMFMPALQSPSPTASAPVLFAVVGSAVVTAAAVGLALATIVVRRRRRLSMARMPRPV
jgi:hypothetical protein